MLWRTFACGMILTIAAVGSQANAQQQQHFHFSAGYAHMSLGGDEFSDDFGGWGMAARWRTQFLENLPNLMLGASFQLSFYDGNDSQIGSLGQIPVNESISDVDMFAPTIDLAWHQQLGDHFFVEPNIGVGWAFASFIPPPDFGRDQTEDGLVIRPGVVLGYTHDEWSVGLDFQYSMYWIDMSTQLGNAFEDDLDDRHDEIYAGVFFRYSF